MQAFRSAPWFLATPPSPGTEMVVRGTVTRLLVDYVRSHPATVVSAPSGYGKTVAVGQWAAHRLADTPGSVAWLTLTKRVTHMDDVLPGIATALQQSARRRGDTRFFRDLTALFATTTTDSGLTILESVAPPEPVAIVIDNFQYARDLLGDPDFDRLIEYGPDWLRLVLVTTDAVDPWLTRLRLHGRLAAVGAGDLTFTTTEIVDAARRLGQPIDGDQAETIGAATGGWPAAVRLALLTGDALHSVTDHHDLTTYIRTAVIGRMRPELAEFVLNTTVSARVDAHMAELLSGRDDAAELLAECASANLFIERFGEGTDVVYQWHSMFVRHCRAILRQQAPDRWRSLNALAARELAREYPLQAVAHTLRAGDGQFATDVIADHWVQLLLESQWTSLDRACIDTMKQVGERADLLMVRACCRGLAGDTVNSTLLFARAQNHGETSSPRTYFIADITRILLSDDYDTMAAAADRVGNALRDPTIVSPTVYACALYVIGWANSRLRRGAPAVEQLQSALNECRALGLTQLAERARQALAFAAANAGEFDHALRVLDRPAEENPDPWLSHDGGGIQRFTSGYVHFWRGELEAALDDFCAVHASVGSGYPDVGRMMLAFTVGALGAHEAVNLAEAALARIPDSDSHGVPWSSYKITSRARLAELRGDAAEAVGLSEQLIGRHNVPMMSAIASGICRRLDAPISAQRLARAGKDVAAQPYSQAYAMLTLALLDWGRGKGASAQRRLEACLTAAAPERVLLPFIDNADVTCAELLAAHTSTTAHRTFLNRCIEACDSARPSAGIKVALTPREQEVLSYLRTPMTASEIAERMSVSVNTLKTHQRAIYRKFGVANRREAVRSTRRSPEKGDPKPSI
ncbi:hypothetical protein BST23_00060 [Mycolicibacterium elephantis]|uniref:HTH luxR-type domain-containing protein n=1 Tax=Mycolicibacterium elephantis TaxID=81858 RepID=A0A1X0D9L9_9MYCO|nr:LuxR C-terminal-related transcriptional regulator [Mycolicibacterium elephantis]ORA69104.1 hypothetical protein BST23_00060 [Mycolicibacterium elephantis]